MKPIAPPPVINKGIAVFVPALDVADAVATKCEIHYSSENPNFNWLNCGPTQMKLWEEIVNYSANGVLFLYKKSNNLNLGFYTIKITVYKNGNTSVSGQIVVGITRDKAKLIVGMPFSTFPPIPLS
jgi:hypothetical protein